ncbi:MAG TPA: ABC transporter permease [Phycisphaerae bacterium]|nr:ABC transporter permease [Phycisphaerae bacterium]
MPNAREKRTGPSLVAGPRINALSVTSLVMLALFVLIILALIAADIFYVASGKATAERVFAGLFSAQVGHAIWMSLVTSLITLVLVIVFSIPAGYALSRFRFPGRAIVNALVDTPIVMPPVVTGLSLLVFFGTPLGRMIKYALESADWSLTSAIGIVLCQFFVSTSYSIRTAAAAFDLVDRGLEQVALTLGCTRTQAFRRVTLPLARSGLLAGCIMAWARAIGIFGPIMVFVGTGPRVLVMPTTIWLELSVGNIEISLAVALVMLAFAGAGLAVVHALEGGGRWWGR